MWKMRPRQIVWTAEVYAAEAGERNSGQQPTDSNLSLLSLGLGTGTLELSGVFPL